MTVEALVAEPLAISSTPRADRRERVTDALTAAGLPPSTDLLDRYPHQLSGGQRQRVALARALVSAPVLLVADEATSMLDVSTRAGIAITLRSLATNRGLAVLFITHDLGEAVQSCDRIMVLKDGQVVEAGPAATLVGEPSHPYTRELLGADSSRQLA
jgi:ABC-type dipeptide/oligopeptide/nickel transport system ATPase component